MIGEWKKLKIFYDGNCLVCHTEIEIYRKHDSLNRLAFVDISKLDFYHDQYPVTKKISTNIFMFNFHQVFISTACLHLWKFGKKFLNGVGLKS